MDDRNKGPILLVCGCAETAPALLGRLHDHGVDVIGPAPTAGLALALAAQTQPSMAIIAGAPTGRRNAEELGQALHESWGVRSWIYDEADGGRSAATPWAVSPENGSYLRRVLDREPGQTEA